MGSVDIVIYTCSTTPYLASVAHNIRDPYEPDKIDNEYSAVVVLVLHKKVVRSMERSVAQR